MSNRIPRNSREITAARLHIIPLNYLREGDRFVAILIEPVKFAASEIRVVAGEAAMDGYWVSESYGFRVGNKYAEAHPESEYINVALDGIEYGGFNKTSDTLYAADGWCVYVTHTVYNRYTEDLRLNNNWETNKKVERLQGERLALHAQLRDIERRIDSRDEQITKLTGLGF
jgi:hypothetical protein